MSPQTNISLQFTSMPREKIRKIRPLFDRVYEPKRGSHYHDQLNTWCQRIGIGPIVFQTRADRLDRSTNQHVYEVIPVFPQLSNHYPLLEYARSSASKPKAQKLSMDALRNVPGMRTSLIRWDFDSEGHGFRATPHVYGEPVPLYDPAVTGYGANRNAAIEDSARKLLLERRFCLFF